MIGATAVPRPPVAGLGRPFLLLWLGQVLSMTGSMLTSFALAVWIFQRTGSVIDFSGTILFATLPALLVTPWAGSIADRADRRRIMLVSTLIAALCTASVGLLVWLGQFQLWHVYAMLTVLSSSAALRGPATQAAVSSLVAKDQLGRASGMLALSGAAAQIAAPLLAGVLLGMIGLSGIIVIDVIGYSIALATLLAIDLPSQKAAHPGTEPHPAGDGYPASRHEQDICTATAHAESGQDALRDGDHAARPATGQPAPSAPLAYLRLITQALRAMLSDSRAAINLLARHQALLLIFGFMSAGAFLSGMVTVLVTPLVLSMYSATTLAIITTSGALGALLGGIAMVAWGGPKRFSGAVLGLNVVEGLAVALAGSVTQVPLLCAAAFGAMLMSTMLGACVENLWRRKVPMSRQGSVFALNQLVTMSVLPLSALLGGALVHYLFEPALLPGGLIFDSIGPWFGSGRGRGTGFFFVVVGGSVALLSLLAMRHPRLRELEREVPDAV